MNRVRQILDADAWISSDFHDRKALGFGYAALAAVSMVYVAQMAVQLAGQLTELLYFIHGGSSFSQSIGIDLNR